MLKARVIPSLLLSRGGLVKTRRFRDATYIGDPINAVKIFNDKEVDELTFLDIEATPSKRGPDFELLEAIVAEAFMPFGYGGGIRSVDDVRKLLSLGIEKVILNTAAFDDPDLVRACADVAGSSSVVVSIDVRTDILRRRRVYVASGKRVVGNDPVAMARRVEQLGAGEILLNCIDRDGMGTGYDLGLVADVSQSVSIPVVALGGAGSLEDMRSAIQAGASAVAAGSFFVFHGRHRAVLISYPNGQALESLFR